MCKQVRAAVVGREEAIALRVVEPLHGACCHALSLYYCWLSFGGVALPEAVPGAPRPRPAMAKQTACESKHSPPFTRRSECRQGPPAGLLLARTAVNRQVIHAARCWLSHCTAPLHCVP